MWGGRYWGGRYWGGRYWGKLGLTVAGYYWGGNYWAGRYWGQRYWGKADLSVPFALAVTNTVAVSGVVTLGGNIGFGNDWAFTQVAGISVTGAIGLTGGSMSFDNAEWSFTPPIPISPITGTVTVGGSFSINGPVTAPGYGGYWGRRYWGGRYFGPRYWGTPAVWNFAQVTGIGLSGVVGVAGGYETTIGFSPGNLAIVGTLGVAGNFVISSGGGVNGQTGAVVYLPLRFSTGRWAETGITSDANRTNLRTFFPAQRTPIARIEIAGQQVPVYLDAQTWYKFFDYTVNTILGGANAPTLNEIVSTVVATIAQNAATAAAVTAQGQQNAANAASLIATVQVLQDNNVPGADQIPPVQPGTNIP